jgi:mono/diheme cytochrome c family protein
VSASDIRCFAVLIAFCASLVPVAHAETPTTATTDGRALFRSKCGVCHLQGGTGTFMLSRRLGEANALLEERTNLEAAYVKHVVRKGIMSMPRLTRAEVSDAELQAIADYLARGNRSSGG